MQILRWLGGKEDSLFLLFGAAFFFDVRLSHWLFKLKGTKRWRWVYYFAWSALNLFLAVAFLAQIANVIVDWNAHLMMFRSPIVALLAVFAALFLYSMKRESLFTYGCFELLAALSAVAISAFAKQATDFQRLAALLTGTYFIVRGLGDVEDGWRRRKMSRQQT